MSGIYLKLFVRINLLWVCLLAATHASAQELDNVPEEEWVVIDAQIPKEQWKGWGLSSPPPGENEGPHITNQNFVVVEYAEDDEEPRTFSGIVVGPRSWEGVEVGLISLEGIHWINDKTYQWEPVAADGSFRIIDQNFLKARKALVVRGPETPWTFLDYNFAPNEGGEEIVLPADEPRKVRITASGEDRELFDWFSLEPFHAVTQHDADDKELRRQRLGHYRSKHDKFIDIVLPAEPVALFVHHKGNASFYVTIDPRTARHFHFVLEAAGKLQISVVDGQGKPVKGVDARWHNPAAPLSIGRGITNDQGIILQNSLVPGKFHVSVGGYHKTVEVDAQHLEKIELVKDENSVFSAPDQSEAK